MLTWLIVGSFDRFFYLQKGFENLKSFDFLTFEAMKIKQNIPNAITLGNLALGFLAILLNDPLLSPMLILAAGVFDLLDGFLARWLNARSELGAQLDSLSDMISFGVAPAFLYYHHVSGNTYLDIALITLVPLFAALRLAIFNISEHQKNVFIGLPSPAAGLFLAFFVYGHSGMENNQSGPILLVLIPLFVALSMLIPIKMLSVKGFSKKTNFEKLLIILVIIGSLIFILAWGWKGLYLGVLWYVFVSLLSYLNPTKKN